MHFTKQYPLRTIVGPAIKINTIEILQESDSSRELDFKHDLRSFEARPLHGESTLDKFFSEIFPPQKQGNVKQVPAEGVINLPTNPKLRFGFQDPMCTLFGIAGRSVTDDKLSRKLSITLQLSLDKPRLVGGISFTGYPYFNGFVDSHGETQMNFGLPREIRVSSTRSGTRDEFIDSQSQYSEQRAISHNGFHYILMDPIHTNTITIQLSDYPIIKYNDPLPGKQAPMHFGFILSSLYVFEYKEDSRYRPDVPIGLLGINHLDQSEDSKPLRGDPTYTFVSNLQMPLTNTNISQYADFTAGSAMGTQREYKFINLTQNKRQSYKECFISKPINPGQKIVLYIEQSEEYRRCIAGLKLQGPTPTPDTGEIPAEPSAENPPPTLNETLNIPEAVKPCMQFRVRAYELDPPEGISPAALDRDGEYVTLLADSSYSVDTLPALLKGLRFAKPSNARYFAIEIQNREASSKQVIIKSLGLIQSANISIQPRPAYNQHVRSIHFRIIGEELADDYAGLGDKGFNFSVERLVAGQKKDVLLEVRSLLDFLHLGAARIYSNGRRRGVEMETSETVGGKPNTEVRTTQIKSAGWRRSELGPEVKAVNKWNTADMPFTSIPGESKDKFEAFNASETRSHNLLLYPHKREEWTAAMNYFNLISDISTVGTRENPVPNQNGYLNSSWRNSHWNSKHSFGQVSGLRTVNISPYAQINTLEEFFRRFLDGDSEAFASVVTGLSGVPALILTGGANTAISAAPAGVGMSLGVNPIPSLMYNTTYGSTGNVLKSGTESLYSYMQALSHSFDDVDSNTTVRNAVSNRKITRTAVRGTDQERIRGAEVMWQGTTADIITGTIPVNINLPATANKVYRNSDDAIIVRLGSGVGDLLSVDIWFDLTEELVKNDY